MARREYYGIAGCGSFPIQKNMCNNCTNLSSTEMRALGHWHFLKRHRVVVWRVGVVKFQKVHQSREQFEAQETLKSPVLSLALGFFICKERAQIQNNPEISPSSMTLQITHLNKSVGTCQANFCFVVLFAHHSRECCKVGRSFIKALAGCPWTQEVTGKWSISALIGRSYPAVDKHL